jgi:hypothetical protein
MRRWDDRHWNGDAWDGRTAGASVVLDTHVQGVVVAHEFGVAGRSKVAQHKDFFISSLTSFLGSHLLAFVSDGIKVQSHHLRISILTVCCDSSRVKVLNDVETLSHMVMAMDS